jgi:hypothetical protein
VFDGYYSEPPPGVVWSPQANEWNSILADATSDGIRDRIDLEPYTVVVRPGRGDGTFGDAIHSYTPYAYTLGVADFDSDGRLDVFTFNYPAGNPEGAWGSVLWGGGNGRFSYFGEDYVFPYGTPFYLGYGDFFGSGRTDVVVGCEWGEFNYIYAVLRNNIELTPKLRIDDASVTEGNAGAVSATFTVRLSVAGSEAITVDYATADGSATAGDYQDAAGSLTFAPGETEKTVTVLVNGDRLAEPNETFVVNLSNPSSATIADGQAVGTIMDDEPRISIKPATRSEGNTGQSPLEFTVTLSSSADAQVTVEWATADGTATAGSDYQTASGALIIPAGETTGTITVPINGDRLAEPNETFVVNLSNPINAPIVSGQVTGTIADDEPRISISDVTKAEGKRGKMTLFTFTVTLSAAYDQPVTMSFQTVNGTARTSNSDYVARSGTLTFAAGETSKTITVTVKGDSKREADESFHLDLFGNSSNSLLDKSRGVGTILNDD